MEGGARRMTVAEPAMMVEQIQLSSALRSIIVLTHTLELERLSVACIFTLMWMNLGEKRRGARL